MVKSFAGLSGLVHVYRWLVTRNRSEEGGDGGVRLPQDLVLFDIVSSCLGPVPDREGVGRVS